MLIDLQPLKSRNSLSLSLSLFLSFSFSVSLFLVIEHGLTKTINQKVVFGRSFPEMSWESSLRIGLGPTSSDSTLTVRRVRLSLSFFFSSFVHRKQKGKRWNADLSLSLSTTNHRSINRQVLGHQHHRLFQDAQTIRRPRGTQIRGENLDERKEQTL